MVSAYYYLLFHGDRKVPQRVERYRHRVQFDDFENVRKNMPDFIEYMFTEHAQGFSRFTWDEFVLSWMDKKAPIVRYEDLLKDTVDTLAAAIEQVTNEKPDIEKLYEISRRFSFENLADRKRGEEDTGSFLRKGIAGDWMNKFTSEACEVFDHYAGDALIKVGYESDRSWIDRFSSAKVYVE
jgi:hypothetical protein